MESANSNLIFIRDVGQGTFGTVEEWQREAESVALKRFKDGLTSDCLREIIFLRALKSVPKMVEFRGIHTTTNDEILIEMPLYDCDLYQYGSNLSFLQRISFFWEVADQLMQSISTLHHFSILHRDIKPNNILLKFHETNAVFDLYLADFGSSCMLLNNIRAVSKEQESISNCQPDTQENELSKDIFTIGFRAPEIIQQLTYDHKADIFALGMTLVYFLFDAVPSEPLIAADMHRWIKREVKKNTKSIDASIIDLLISLTQYDKNDRTMMIKENLTRNLSLSDLGPKKDWRNVNPNLSTKVYFEYVLWMCDVMPSSVTFLIAIDTLDRYLFEIGDVEQIEFRKLCISCCILVGRFLMNNPFKVSDFCKTEKYQLQIERLIVEILFVLDCRILLPIECSELIHIDKSMLKRMLLNLQKHQKIPANYSFEQLFKKYFEC